MEMESLHALDHTETTIPAHSSQPHAYRDAQVWKDIEAETGFASYEDYLDYHMDLRPDFEDKLWDLQNDRERFDKDGSDGIKTVIYDLSIQGNSSTRLSPRCYCRSGTELIQALRKPPDDVCVQLVVWLRTDSPLNKEMVDTLGLGLRLDPDDFHYRRHWSPPPRKSGPRIKSIFGEQTVISQGFMRDAAKEVPVVLVAFSLSSNFSDLDFTAELCETPPFCKSPRVITQVEGAVDDYDVYFLQRIGLNYARAVQNFILQGRDVQPTKLSLLLASLLPLLYAEQRHITNRINKVQEMYTGLVFERSPASEEPRVTQKGLDKGRLELRRRTELSEDVLGQFSRYLGSEGHPDLSSQPSYISLVANLRSLIADARRLDTEVRDFKQIQVGDLALEESRKSIELSNSQIREAKSGKFQDSICVKYADIPQ